MLFEGGREHFVPGLSDHALSSGIDIFFHPETFPLNHDGLCVMQETVEDGRGQCSVMVEDFRPILKGPVGGNNHGAPFISVDDDLKKEIRSPFVNG
jgi:hypothetical protein